MKKSGVISFLVVFMALLPGINLKISAQANQYSMMAGLGPFPGYVILSSGDTLHGKVKWAMKYVENNPSELKFTAENGNSKTFNASEIKGCGITMSDSMDPLPMPPEHYVTLPSFKKGVPVFIRRLMEGRLTVYQNRSAVISSNSVTEETSKINGIAFTFTLADGLYIGPSYRTEYRVIKERPHASSYYIVKDGASMIKVEKDNYETLFSNLFGDCSSIDQELTKNPDLKKFKNFMLLAEVYNEICNNNPR
jgi:hypothetical protein